MIRFSTSEQEPNEQQQAAFAEPISAGDVLDYWQALRKKRKPRPYVTTHARRFAVSFNEILKLHAPVDLLDIGGNDVSRHFINHFLKPDSYLATPRELDLEIDDWASTVPQAHFDFAVCTEVIEHMSADPAFMLHQANRCLKPGGLLFITTPNICSGVSLYNAIHGRTPYHWGVMLGERGDRHHREYAPYEIQELVAMNGFAAALSTINAYEESPHSAMANAWIRENVPDVQETLLNDTILLFAQKVSEPEQPFRLEPIYGTSIADTRDEGCDSIIEQNISTPINISSLNLPKRR